jgi:hypothetical protein
MGLFRTRWFSQEKNEWNDWEQTHIKYMAVGTQEEWIWYEAVCVPLLPWHLLGVIWEILAQNSWFPSCSFLCAQIILWDYTLFFHNTVSFSTILSQLCENHDIWLNGGIAPQSASWPTCFTPGKISFNTHWIRNWQDSRAGVDTEKMIICCLCWESDLDSLVVLPSTNWGIPAIWRKFCEITENWQTYASV